MKKAMLIMLTAALLCGMTACGGGKDDSSASESEAATSAAATETESEADSEADSETESKVDSETGSEVDSAVDSEVDSDAAMGADSEADSAADSEASAESSAESNGESAESQADVVVSGDSLGQTLRADFEAKAADGTMSCQILADELLKNPAILFSPVTMPVEPGLLTGFGNAEITGFKEATMFAPMIGSIAFVGYIFELEDGTDGEAFMQTLKDNADPRWNICVEAEEMVVSQTGNKVFFVMSPMTLEG